MAESLTQTRSISNRSGLLSRNTRYGWESSCFGRTLSVSMVFLLPLFPRELSLTRRQLHCNCPIGDRRPRLHICQCTAIDDSHLRLRHHHDPHLCLLVRPHQTALAVHHGWLRDFRRWLHRPACNSPSTLSGTHLRLSLSCRSWAILPVHPDRLLDRCDEFFLTTVARAVLLTCHYS